MKKSDYEALKEEISHHDRLYYQKHRPEISDYDYDLLYQKLLAAEKEHPEWVASDSPSRKVAPDKAEGFLQKEHLVPMMSLANTYSREEVEEFMQRVKKLAKREEISFSLELKMDGTALSVLYRKGKMVHAVTRGDGVMGDDVTRNIEEIADVPKEIQWQGEIEVRGEVYLSKEAFLHLNQERQKEGEELFVNPRNAAAGSLKLLDPHEAKKRKLHCLFYGIAEGMSPSKTQHETIAFLQKEGFFVGDAKWRKVAHSAEEIFAHLEKIEEIRPHLPFEIDGVVIKVDDLSLYPLLGVTGKAPRYAAAYKFSPEQAETEIVDITVQVGRSGVLTPVAELKPVLLAGSTIARATLHNAEEVERKGIRIHDRVVIEKGGDVIPKVVRVAHHAPHSKAWSMPSHCPACGEKVVKAAGEVAVRCVNRECSGQRVKRLEHFVSRQALDIEHLGAKIIELLVERELIALPSDLYHLAKEDLLSLPGFQEKSATNLLASIEKSKTCPLSRLIMGLGIPSVGKETAEVLAHKAKTIEGLFELTEEELVQLEGIGEKSAHLIANALPSLRAEIDHLLKAGVTPSYTPKRGSKGDFLEGKSFVLTGTLPHYSREEATALIEERGGKVTGSVTKKTHYLLLGENPGSKYEIAKKLNIEILDEEQFNKLLNLDKKQSFH